MGKYFGTDGFRGEAGITLTADHQLGIRPMNKDDIIEVDNLSELIALDASYKNYMERK